MSAKKRIISVILSFVMVIGMCATTFAAESIPDVAGVTQEEYMKEAEDTMKDYIRINRMDTSDLSMSQPISINGSNDENNRVIFLFRGTKCIALMMFTYVNHEYASSFSEGDYAEITDALNKNQNIALVSNEECMVMLTDDSWEIVTGNKDFVQETALSKARASYERQVFRLTPIVFSDEEIVYDSRSDAATVLNVTQVYNDKHPDITERGMCWAAAMVSIIRYRAGAKQLTIYNLYSMLKSAYPSDDYGYPIGICDWVTRSYKLYGLSYTHTHSGANFSKIKSCIRDNRPVYADLSRSGGAHAVVIAGFESAYGKYYYRIMDPNNDPGCPTFLLVEIPSATATAFTFVSPGGFTYTGWRCHMY